MYEIRIHIVSEKDKSGEEMPCTTFIVEAVHGITRYGQPQTLEDAVELGITTAFMRFLRNISDRMPEQDTLDLSDDEEVPFPEVVYRVRACTLESLHQAARDYLDSFPPQQAPETPVDWDALFRGLVQSFDPDIPERGAP